MTHDEIIQKMVLELKERNGMNYIKNLFLTFLSIPLIFCATILTCAVLIVLAILGHNVFNNLSYKIQRLL